MSSNQNRHNVPPERVRHLGNVSSKPFQHTRGQLAADSLCKLNTEMILYCVIGIQCYYLACLGNSSTQALNLFAEPSRLLATTGGTGQLWTSVLGNLRLDRVER